jgi:NTE family protein
MTLREWLREGEFTLAMSSGFFGFFAHAGMLTVLEQEGLVPTGLAGSSAGALVAGLWGAGLPMPHVARALVELRRDEFWDPGLGAGLLKGDLFRSRLEALLPVQHLEQCRVPVALSVFDLASRRTRVVESGPLAPALQASCALPLMFQPVRVNGRLSSDGGIADRPGLAGVPEGRRVLAHHLSSKSPWRRAGDPDLKPPRRDRLVSLVIDGLVRVNPFQLGNGRRAYEQAALATSAALDRVPVDGVVSLTASI